MKQKQTLIFTFLSGVLCADLLLRTVFLLDAWSRGRLGGILGFLVKKSGPWLTVSVLLCAAALGIGLFGKLCGKAGGTFLFLALACGITEWSLFHLRILPGKAGVYAFFISVPLFFLCELIGMVFCTKAAWNALRQKGSNEP